MEIDWNKYFEKIYIYSCAENFDRRKYLNSELKRIGCKDYEYFITCKDDKLINSEHFNHIVPNKSQQITHGEYLIIKTAYELGYNNILLLEDDITFLNDVEEIYNQLEIFYDIKDQYNIYMFDYLQMESIIFLSSGLYLDRKGMEYMIYCVENYDFPIDGYFTLLLNDFTTFSIFFYEESTYIEIPKSIGNITLGLSPLHVCIQKNMDYPRGIDIVDTNLYNKDNNIKIIDWNKYFDHIYILSSCSNFEKRKQLENEFKRIGINNYKWHYNCYNNIINQLTNNMPNNYKQTTYGHYTLIKTAYELGYDNILICEDDIRFLKDIDEIENQLNIFLENKDKCDFYFFDYFCSNLANDSYDNIFKFDCIYLNRNAMKYMIYCIEHFNLNIDNYIITNYLYPNNCTNINCNIWGNNLNISKEDNILPIQVILSPIRLCLESFTLDRSNDFEEIKNKYNLE